MTFRVAAVIVNYNGAAVLPGCVKSLLALGMPELRIVVIDNASGDEPQSYLPVHGSIELIQLRSNAGYAGGAAIGVERALQDSDVAAVAVLNSDLIIDGSFGNLLRAFGEGRLRDGLYATILLNPDGSIQNMGQVWSRRTGIVTTRLSVPREPDSQGLLWLARNEFLCGAAIVGTSIAFTKVKFDRELVLLCEDLDLCMQAHNAGIPIAIATDCNVVHTGRATFGANRGMHAYYLWRNSPLMSARYGSAADFFARMVLLPFQLFHHILVLVRHNDWRSTGPLIRGAITGTKRAIEYRVRPTGAA